ncbi:hypothetical protein GG344DRAFT_67842 [Lentinula edodes]|nr:hypothetical protein GG344DRAFT_67842 [Lentinula edodes]
MPQITCAEVQNELFDIVQAFTVASHLMEDSDKSNDDSFQLDDGFDDEEAQNFDGEFTDSVVVSLVERKREDENEKTRRRTCTAIERSYLLVVQYKVLNSNGKWYFSINCLPRHPNSNPDQAWHSLDAQTLLNTGSAVSQMMDYRLPETPTTAVPLNLHRRARSDNENSLSGGGHGVYRTTETAIASESAPSHLSTSSGGTFTGTLANSNAHNLPLSSTHSHNFSQGPDPSHEQVTPGSSFLQRQSGSVSASSDSQQTLLLAAHLQSALYPPPREDPLDMVGWGSWVKRKRMALVEVTILIPTPQISPSFRTTEARGEGLEVSEFSEVDSGVNFDFGDSSNSDASSVVVRYSRPTRVLRGGRGKKKKGSPGYSSGVNVG